MTVIRTVRHSASCNDCDFHVSDSALVVVDAAWEAHRDTTGHVYCTTTSVTTTADRRPK